MRAKDEPAWQAAETGKRQGGTLGGAVHELLQSPHPSSLLSEVEPWPTTWFEVESDRPTART